MGKSTLDMMGKILAEDRAAYQAQKKRAEKSDHGYGIPTSDYAESITIKKADAGGMILCWYGPNGSRDIIVQKADEIPALVEKFFSGTDNDED